MRKLLLLPLLFLAGCTQAFAAGNNLTALAWSFQCASLSESAPATDPDVGNTKTDQFTSSVVAGAIKLTGGTGFRTTLFANSGQTLSGAGNIKYAYCPSVKLPAGFTSSVCAQAWPINDGLKETVTLSGTGQTFPDHPAYVMQPGSWVRPFCSGITETGGATTPTILIEIIKQI